MNSTHRPVNIGRWMHYTSETNIPNAEVYFVRPSTLDTLDDQTPFDWTPQEPSQKDGKGDYYGGGGY
uniref:Uncharacterized protein n=1 Tax=viral metagenome TaxID=1070528 RepID=A0A6C0LXM0_9ZZZZ